MDVCPALRCAGDEIDHLILSSELRLQLIDCKLLDWLAGRWAPDGLGCYRRDEDGSLALRAARGRLSLPPRLPRPGPGPLTAPDFGYSEEHLLPLGAAGWLYLGYEGRSVFTGSDPAFLLLARHLELVLRVR